MKSNKLRNVVFTFVGIAAFAAAAIAWQTEEESPGPSTVKLDPNAKYARPSDDQLRQRLTPLQYRVTQEEGTESPFSNQYWDNREEGIYVDIASGEPLFSSKEKFKSGTGWPSFFKPLVGENVTEHADYSLLGKRIEVRSLYGDSHLGHVFNDGPNPTGLRYCINSAALKFVPVESLESEGYGEFKSHFE